jgi:hypothetical protein
MPTKTVPRGNTRRPDPEGAAWHAEARTRWDAAGGDIDRYEAPPLPVFIGAAHVTRELLGRYLVDRDTQLVHDVQHALEECELDAIRNGTFYHFESELPADEFVDCACMGA